MKQQYALELVQLSYLVGSRYLLKDIDWQVKKGEHWVIFGLNGCGKTTLLSMIAGYNHFTSGQLNVLGEAYEPGNALALRKKIGWVSSSFFDHYYSQETVLMIALSGLFGTMGVDEEVSNQEIIKAKRLLKELHLGDKIDHPFDLLSKGERQNALIARALIANPEILVFDEPGTGLDVYAREHMLSTITDLAQNKDLTIIDVTHYTEEILALFDQCALMKQGQIVAQGSTKDLFNDVILSRFLDFPVAVRHREEQMYVSLEVPSKVYEILWGDDQLWH